MAACPGVWAADSLAPDPPEDPRVRDARLQSIASL